MAVFLGTYTDNTVVSNGKGGLTVVLGESEPWVLQNPAWTNSGFFRTFAGAFGQTGAERMEISATPGDFGHYTVEFPVASHSISYPFRG